MGTGHACRTPGVSSHDLATERARCLAPSRRLAQKAPSSADSIRPTPVRRPLGSARGDMVRWRLTSPNSIRPTPVRRPLDFARGDMVRWRLTSPSLTCPTPVRRPLGFARGAALDARRLDQASASERVERSPESYEYRCVWSGTRGPFPSSPPCPRHSTSSSTSRRIRTLQGMSRLATLARHDGLGKAPHLPTQNRHMRVKHRDRGPLHSRQRPRLRPYSRRGITSVASADDSGGSRCVPSACCSQPVL
jgi:hypothetical protein